MHTAGGRGGTTVHSPQKMRSVVRQTRWMPPATAQPRPPATSREVDAAVELLAGKRIAVLTGAGVSTDSGIPDYRSPDSPPRNPMTYQQFVGDSEFRRHYWARNHVGWRHMRATFPNDAHHAIARLERDGVAVGVITQNVDRLHQAAGSHRVVDLHGHYNRVVCLACGHTMTRTELDALLTALNPGYVERVSEVGDVEVAPDADAVIAQTSDFRVADCPACGGMLKPDIVYFGESVPPTRVAEAFAIVDDAEALVVAGSSLAVMSGLRFVRHAARAGQPVVIVNRGVTRGDDSATLLLHGGASQVLTAFAGRLPALLVSEG